MVYSQSIRFRDVFLDTSSSIFHRDTQPPVVIFQKGAA